MTALTLKGWQQENAELQDRIAELEAENHRLSAQVSGACADRDNAFSEAAALSSALVRTKKKLADAQNNAERYRWLRSEKTITGAMSFLRSALYHGSDMDEAIDKARGIHD